ncbi:MAG: hypothetical protein BGP09_18125 [Rhizobium sp. 60-20]|nr:MAG: hypothetical protein BGP09_18125 [Rhizobium sp. 60-20]
MLLFQFGKLCRVAAESVCRLFIGAGQRAVLNDQGRRRANRPFNGCLGLAAIEGLRVTNRREKTKTKRNKEA